MKNYRFNVDWWNNVCNNFLDGPAFMKRFVDVETNALQIGCFEGMGTVWMLDNILTHENSRLIDIDPFYSDGDLAGANFDTVQKLYYYNLAECPTSYKHKIIVGRSQDVLSTLPLNSFDLIYIDGSHFAKDIIIDAELSHKLLKVGGMMFFDDYGWGEEQGKFSSDKPKWAVDEFLEKHKGEYKIIDIHYQAVIEKVK